MMEGNLPEDSYHEPVYHPLAPLYCQHLRPFSILDSLKWNHSNEKSVTIAQGSGENLADRILALAVPSDNMRGDCWLAEDKDNLKECIDKYGIDIVRTYAIFRYQPSRKDPNPRFSERGILEIEQWFQTSWGVVDFAHALFTASQTKPPPEPNIPEALYEPNMETWLDHKTDLPKSYVLIPSDLPDFLKSGMSKYDDKVWLSAQNAILSLSKPISVSNSLIEMERSLVKLIKALGAFEGSEYISVDVNYHATKALLCLIAPLAPAYAEELWVMLHYGPQKGSFKLESSQEGASTGVDWVTEDLTGKMQSIEKTAALVDKPQKAKEKGVDGDYQAKDNIKEDEDEEEEIDQDLVDLELEDEEELRHLPRRGRPETLSSIFEQTPPVPEPAKIVKLLEARVIPRERNVRGEKLEEDQV